MFLLLTLPPFFLLLLLLPLPSIFPPVAVDGSHGIGLPGYGYTLGEYWVSGFRPTHGCKQGDEDAGRASGTYIRMHMCVCLYN